MTGTRDVLQLEALQQELLTVCDQYDDSLHEVERLTAEVERLRRAEQALQVERDHATRRITELVDRERQYREVAETWVRDSETMSDEIETASLVQRFMVRQDPIDDVEGVEVASSYRPAGQTSGDWFGFDRDDHSFTVMLADATGHGLPAALLTAGLFAVTESLRVVSRMAAPTIDLHAHLAMVRQPDLLLQILHETIEVMGGGRFGVSFIAARYEPGHHLMRIARAAHPPVMWVRRGAAAATQIMQPSAEGTMPLGLGGARRGWAEQRITLTEGDLLLFHTDGFTDVTDRNGRTLGLRRTAGWLYDARDLPVAAARDQLQSRFDEFVSGHVVNDDVTFVLVRITR
ncbi:MAG: SpoIIE family protein phosphatase [Kofleriaceae bacterium]